MKRTPRFSVDQELGLNFTGNLHTNFGGLGEHWLIGNDGTWYYITPAGDLYQWDGTSGGDNGPLHGTLVAMLGHEYHDDPSLLYDAADPSLGSSSGTTITNVDFGNYQTVSIHGRKWHDVNNDGLILPPDFGIGGGDGDLYPPEDVSIGGNTYLYDAFDSQEYWFQDSLGNWYFLLPDGNLYEWDGSDGSATGTVVSHVGAGFYNNPDLLVNPIDEPYLNGWVIELLNEDGFVIATDTTDDFDINGDGEIDPTTERGWYMFDDLPPGTYSVREIQQEGWVQIFPVEAEFAEAAFDLDQTYGFQTSGDFHRNFGGEDEVWIQDRDDQWYYITETGTLVEWDTVSRRVHRPQRNRDRLTQPVVQPKPITAVRPVLNRNHTLRRRIHHRLQLRQQRTRRRNLSKQQTCCIRVAVVSLGWT